MVNINFTNSKLNMAFIKIYFTRVQIKEEDKVIGQRLFERRLKPAINNATDGTVLVTNGFSCFEQMSDGHAKRCVLHPVEVIEMCLQSY